MIIISLKFYLCCISDEFILIIYVSQQNIQGFIRKYYFFHLNFVYIIQNRGDYKEIFITIIYVAFIKLN